MLRYISLKVMKQHITVEQLHEFIGYGEDGSFDTKKFDILIKAIKLKESMVLEARLFNIGTMIEILPSGINISQALITNKWTVFVFIKEKHTHFTAPELCDCLFQAIKTIL